MLRHRYLYRLSLLFCVFCCGVSAAKDINIAYTEFPPFSYTDKNNSANGKLIQIYRELMELAALEPHFVPLPTRRVYEFIQQGKVDMWAVIPGSNIPIQDVLMSQQPLIEIQMQAYWKAGTNPISSSGDLKNKQVILISSYSYGGLYNMLVSSAPEKTRFAIDHEDGFKQLHATQETYLLAYKMPSDAVIEKFKLEGYEHLTLDVLPVHIKLKQSFPNAKILLRDIDNALLKSK